VDTVSRDRIDQVTYLEFRWVAFRLLLLILLHIIFYLLKLPFLLPNIRVRQHSGDLGTHLGSQLQEIIIVFLSILCETFLQSCELLMDVIQATFAFLPFIPIMLVE